MKANRCERRTKHDNVCNYRGDDFILKKPKYHEKYIPSKDSSFLKGMASSTNSSYFKKTSHQYQIYQNQNPLSAKQTHYSQNFNKNQMEQEKFFYTHQKRDFKSRSHKLINQYNSKYNNKIELKSAKIVFDI